MQGDCCPASNGMQLGCCASPVVAPEITQISVILLESIVATLASDVTINIDLTTAAERIQVSPILLDDSDALPTFSITIIESTAPAAPCCPCLAASMLAAQEEIAARLLSAELELISATSADVSDPPPLEPPPPGPPAKCVDREPCTDTSGNPCVLMRLSEVAAAGTSVLKVDKMECGLEVGLKVHVGLGTDHAELVTISGFGSILLSETLASQHAVGEAVVPDNYFTSPPPAPRPPVADLTGNVAGSSNDESDVMGVPLWLVALVVVLLFVCCCLVLCCCWWRARQEGSRRESAAAEPKTPGILTRSMFPIDQLAAMPGSVKNVVGAKQRRFTELEKANNEGGGRRKKIAGGGAHGHRTEAEAEMTMTEASRPAPPPIDESGPSAP